jgi:hypothetical protein
LGVQGIETLCAKDGWNAVGDRTNISVFKIVRSGNPVGITIADMIKGLQEAPKVCGLFERPGTAHD